MGWNELPIKQSFRQRLKDIFGDISFLWYSFDDAQGARTLLQDVLTDVEWTDFGPLTVEKLVNWHDEFGPQIKRQRRIQIDLSFENCTHPRSTEHVSVQENFEQIMNDDPRYVLDVVKRAQRKGPTGEGMDSKAAKEQLDRERYALELAGIIQEAFLPISLQIDSLQDPNKAWLRLFGARR